MLDGLARRPETNAEDGPTSVEFATYGSDEPQEDSPMNTLVLQVNVAVGLIVCVGWTYQQLLVRFSR